MSQPEESREKTQRTDAVLLHPHNDPNLTSSEMPPQKEHGPVLVERDGKLVPADQVE